MKRSTDEDATASPPFHGIPQALKILVTVITLVAAGTALIAVLLVIYDLLTGTPIT